jgi:RecB family exonuclease
MNEIAAPSAPGDASLSPLAVRESYSSLSMYEACPRRYAHHYVEHVPGEVPPGWFTFGSAVHRAFEAFDRARIAARHDSSPPPGYDALWMAFTETVDASGCSPYEIARFRARGEPVLRAYLEREWASDAEPIAVELSFGIDVPIGDDQPAVRFVGFVDRIARRPGGSVEILDHKTGSPQRQEEVDRDVQLTAYAFASARGGLRDPASGQTLPAPSRLGLHFAEPGLTVWTTRSVEALDAFGGRLCATVGRIRRREFAAHPGPACRWCEYRATCPDGTPRTA